MNVNIFFVVMLWTIGAASSKTIGFQRCSSQTLGEIISVDVTPCDQDPCIFRPGNQETFTVKFIPHKYITSPKLYASGTKGSMIIPLMRDKDACQGYGLKCPLQAGVQAELVFSIKLPSFSILRGEYGMEAYIKDQNDNLVVCGKIDLVIS